MKDKFFIESNLAYYDLVKKVLHARSKYLEVKQWFENATKEEQQTFISLCRSFREKPFTAYRRENYTQLVQKAVEFELLMSGKSQDSLTASDRLHFDLTNVLTLSTYHGTQDRDRMFGFMSQSYVINYSIMRVFYESEYFTAGDAIEHTSMINHSDSRILIYHLDNLLCWVRKAQEAIYLAKNSSMKSVFQKNINQAIKRMYYKPSTSSDVMYAKLVVACHDLLDKEFWKYKVPRLADFDHHKSRRFMLYKGNSDHSLTFILKFCLLPLLNILGGNDLIDFSEHDDLRITQFAKLETKSVWNNIVTSKI